MDAYVRGCVRNAHTIASGVTYDKNEFNSRRVRPGSRIMEQMEERAVCGGDEGA